MLTTIVDSKTITDMTDTIMTFVGKHPFLTFLLIVIVISVSHLLSWLPRTLKLSRWARRSGLKFSMWHDAGFKIRHGGFRCLLAGQNQFAYNVCCGRWNGWDVFAFDYKCTTQTLAGSQDKNFSAVLVKPEFRLKPLQIRAEAFSDRLADFMGKGDIDFESAEFSDKFYVAALDRKWAYDVLNLRAIEYLLKSPADKFFIQFSENEVLLTKLQEGIMKPYEFEAALNIATSLLFTIPEYAKHD